MMRSGWLLERGAMRNDSASHAFSRVASTTMSVMPTGLTDSRPCAKLEGDRHEVRADCSRGVRGAS
jgi:hypothetical protein